MADLSPRERRLAQRGIIDRRTGELTSYGEMLAAEGRQMSDAGDDFSEMGPDLGPHDPY